jgi:hypothetical protein
MIMKNMKSIFLTLFVFSFAAISCDENNDVNTPKPATTANDIKANFLGINAVADGPALNFFVNGVQVSASDAGTSVAGYTAVPIQTGFTATGGALANTAIRAKAASGSIGGLLGSNDLIYRAGNTSINNLVASANALYTVIALDSIRRPVPLRTFSLNTVTNALAADVTYYNRASGTQISNDAFKALPIADQARCVSLGTIPAGTTDAGGPRYLLLTDTYPTFSGNNLTQSGVRVVNAIPNSYATPVNTRISVRLRPASGANVALGTNLEYALSVPGGFSPSVGSRATTSAFSLQTTATSSGPGNSTPIVYTLEASTDGFATIVASVANVQLQANKVYTIVAKGIIGKPATLGLIVVQHN